uniref:B-cell scaffold protein with ankyrin repeats-like n=1 Tax=Pristiophorus japonicus TaxID=55135 RepID=UPI00398EC768
MRRSVSSRADLVILYEEEAEEWSTYLKQIFLERLDPQNVCCYSVGCANDLQIAVPSLSAYRCKLLVLTTGFLSTLTVAKRVQLSKILQPPGTVVILLCGVPSSNTLYELVPAERGIWEISSEQDPEDYLSVVISIIESGPSQQQEDPAEELTSEGDNHSEDATSDSLLESAVSDWQQQVGMREDPVGAPTVSDAVVVPVLVMPTRIQCKTGTEIYMLLRDGLSFGEDPEVEFMTSTEKVKVQPTIWNSQTLCVKALDLPAGPVTMSLYCRGSVIAKADVVYYTGMEEIERLLMKAADPIEFICQAFQINSQDQLDQLLTRSLQNSLPPTGLGAFQTLGPDSDPDRHSRCHNHEFPTLLHFAAKYGLEKLTSLLLECPGAAQASAALNTYGESPRDLAAKNRSQHVGQLFDRFTVSTKRSENQWQETLRGDSGVHQQEKEEGIYEMMAQIDSSQDCSNEDDYEDVECEEDPYTLTLDDEDPYDLILPEGNSSVEVKKESAGNFVKRPPAPIPRPTSLQCADNTPFIAQVFQQKTGKGTEEKVYALPKQAARAKVDENQMYDTFGVEYNPSQQRLIHLQELVKKGVLTVDEAQEKFKLWQTEQKDQDAVQQEKLRKLRENIIKDRHDVEDLYDKLRIIHLSDDTNTRGDESMYSTPAAKGRVAPASLCAKLANPK